MDINTLKPGDVVYRIYTRSHIRRETVKSVHVKGAEIVAYKDDMDRYTPSDVFGKTVFLTYEEAEKALIENKARQVGKTVYVIAYPSTILKCVIEGIKKRNRWM